MSAVDKPLAGPDQPRPRFELGPRVFAAPANSPRARRASDLIMLVVSALGVGILAVIAHPSAGFVKALDAFLASSPDFLDGLWQLVLDGLALYALVLVVLAAARRRWRLLVDMVLVVVVATVAALVVGRVVDGSWPQAWESLWAAAPPAWFPSQRIAVTGAVLLAANPYLSLPLRRFSRRLLASASLAAVVLGAASAVGAAAGVLLASVAASVVHVIMGSSAGRPSLDQIAAALVELGVRPRDLSAATRQTEGFYTLSGHDEHGPLVVKVYGRDAYDTQLVASLWRTIWYRSDDTPIALSRLEYVQHEALLTLLAAQAGIPVDRVVTAADTANGDAFVVLRPNGTPIAELGEGWLSAEGSPHATNLVSELWAMVDRLHVAGISHSQIDPTHLTITPDGLGLSDFRAARVAAEPERMLRDDAQALVTSVVLVGSEAALAAAVDARGHDRLVELLPLLQAPALTDDLRDRLRADELELDDLRDAIAELAGVEAPELRKLRRVTWGSLLTNGLMVVAFALLWRAGSRLDLDTLGDTLRDARWWLVAVAAVVAQVPRVTQSLSTLGACPLPLPLRPVYALQLAVSYINLAVPTTAARVAVSIRFFQRQGLPSGTALGIGALDGFAGFVIQVSLLGSMLLFTSASLDLELDFDLSGTAGSLLAVVGLFAVVAVALVLGRATWRRALVDLAAQLLRDASSTLRGLRSPRRLALLLGGSLATEVTFALTLALFVRAMGYQIGFGEVLLINLSVALLSGLVPVPGGIGVAEGGLTFGLVSAGIPEEAALGAVICYRIATFYAPPIWGFFALRWLERNRHL